MSKVHPMIALTTIGKISSAAVRTTPNRIVKAGIILLFAKAGKVDFRNNHKGLVLFELLQTISSDFNKERIAGAQARPANIFPPNGAAVANCQHNGAKSIAEFHTLASFAFKNRVWRRRLLQARPNQIQKS